MCGWGGEGYGHGRSIWTWHDFTHRDYPSYVNPNARCPVCQEPVYFYQSPDGGRVFFDDLGPPWPKHPCTDSNQSWSREKVSLLDSILLDVQLLAIGRMQGWKPFISIYIRDLPNGELRIHGRFYRRDGRPGLETYLDTLDARGDRGRDLNSFHHHGSGLPFFVRAHAADGYLELAEIDLLAKHGSPEQMRSRSTHGVTCLPPENGMRRIRQELRA
jgi:hypothetical protein